jgi:hypothetical protein
MTPAEMLNIFRSNIVVVRGIPTADPGGQDHFKITKKTGAIGEARRGQTSIAVDVMQLERANPGDANAFLTWVLDYASNDIKYVTLSPARTFCFTATMNGCTFGIGSASPNGVLCRAPTRSGRAQQTGLAGRYSARTRWVFAATVR